MAIHLDDPADGLDAQSILDRGIFEQDGWTDAVFGNELEPDKIQARMTRERAFLQGSETTRAMSATQESSPAKRSSSVKIYEPLNLEVDTNLSQVRFKNNVHNVTPDQALALAALVDAKGDWIALNRLLSKPSRTMGDLPDCIKHLFKSMPGKGYRLLQ